VAVVLADLLDENQIALDLRAQTRDEALGEIVDLWVANGKIEDPGKFLAAVIDRERKTSSAVEHAVAFLHARTDLVQQIVLGIGRSTQGVRFDQAREPVRLIFLIGVPRQMIQDYLVCVGALARLAKDEEIRHGLLQARTAGEFIEQLRAASLSLD
jgi:mannitol/fructose-specific phosphotransferase system IIA component (Ntr-type)